MRASLRATVAVCPALSLRIRASLRTALAGCPAVPDITQLHNALHNYTDGIINLSLSKYDKPETEAAVGVRLNFS